MGSELSSGGILTIDLDALAENWRTLRDKSAPAACAAAIKADAYGLGAERAAVTLAGAGCRDFFVALVDEGIHLRDALDAAGMEARIHVLGGPLGDLRAFIEFDLVPVLNSLDDIRRWKAFRPDVPADIHVDTGMLRLGLSPTDLAAVTERPELVQGLTVAYVISHLACSEEPENPKNPEQLAAFRHALALFPGSKASFANSSGIYLGASYLFDLTRPGVALYGVNPTPGLPNPMSQVVRLQGQILQVRDVDTPQTVGYGATHRIERKGRIATVGVGYADGYHRTLSSRGFGFLGDLRVELVGRVSMDLITFDVSDAPEHMARPGALIDLIGPNNPIDEVAKTAGTVGYEFLATLGPRFHRVYKGGE